MKTEVETFMMEESRELIYDNEQLDKWRQIVESLNLKGQQQITQQGASPVPFLLMTARLTNLLETVCPRKIALEEYSRTPIPVEILKLIAISQREGYFDDIRIWCDDRNENLLCVGSRYASAQDKLINASWNMNQYLLGRWGASKIDFEQLKQKARDLYRARRIVELERIIRTAQRELEDMDWEVAERIG